MSTFESDCQRAFHDTKSMTSTRRWSSAMSTLGSANITHGGLTVNREVCEVIENEHGTAEASLTEELDLSLPE